MTNGELKAWIDGMCEAVGDAPTPEQWSLIRAKINHALDPLNGQKPGFQGAQIGGFGSVGGYQSGQIKASNYRD